MFEEPKEEKSKGKDLLLFPEEETKPAKPKTQKKSTGKNFTDDLQSFLREAFEESFEEQFSTPKDKLKEEKRIKKRRKKPLSGLDALIRQTVRPQPKNLLDQPTRRVTLTFDHQKLEKLKKIARLNNTYLKDIINEIVSEYIEKHEGSKDRKRK